MTVCCVAPNGINWVHAQSAPTRLLIGTLDGIEIFVRDELGAPWAKTGTVLDGKHVSSMMYEPGLGGVFAGIHNGGLFFSGDAGENQFTRRSAHDTCGVSSHVGTGLRPHC